MSILHTSNESESRRVKLACISELEKMVRLAKDNGITVASLMRLDSSLTKIELMILDSAFKDLNLENTNNTLLLLEDKYIDMLQKLTYILIKAFEKRQIKN